MTGRFYRPELDVLRFFAFFAVFLCHALSFQSRIVGILDYALAYGVQIFFLLSAYLIGELLRREKQDSGTIHIRAFYMRRMLRIWPLYLGVVFTVYFVGLRFLPFHLPRGVVPSYILVVGNWYSHRFGYRGNPINHLWTISIEEQFYLFIPVLVLRLSPRSLLKVCILLVLTAYGAVLAESCLGANEWQMTTDSFIEFQFFAAGLFIASLLRGKVPRYAASARLALFLAGLAFWISSSIVSEHHVTSVPPFAGIARFALSLCGSLAIFFAFLGMKTEWIPGWLVYLGKISYGLYVFHYIILNTFGFNHVSKWMSLLGFEHTEVMTHAVLGFVTTLLVAHLSYKYYESPFLRIKGRFEWVRSRSI